MTMTGGIGGRCRCDESTAFPGPGQHLPGCLYYSPVVYVQGAPIRSKCVCGHVQGHHYGTMMGDGHCTWLSCGCPKFIEETAHT